MMARESLRPPNFLKIQSNVQLGFPREVSYLPRVACSIISPGPGQDHLNLINNMCQ